MEHAVKAAKADEFHIEKNYRYLTPEYILRENQMEKWLNVKLDPESSFEEE